MKSCAGWPRTYHRQTGRENSSPLWCVKWLRPVPESGCWLIGVDHAVGAGGARHGECDALPTTELRCAQRHCSRVQHWGSPHASYFGCPFHHFRFVNDLFRDNGLRHFFYFRRRCRGFRFTRRFLFLAELTLALGVRSRVGSGASGSGNGVGKGIDSTTAVGADATVGTVSCCTLAVSCALSSTLTSCCVFAFAPTSEIVIPSTGTAISAPTTPRMIFGCFARTSGLKRPLMQEIAFWLHGRLNAHVDPPVPQYFLQQFF